MIAAREPLRVATYVTSKLGEDIADCEDVVRIQHHGDATRIGMSDGATTSSFSREWATQLAEWFSGLTEYPTHEAFSSALGDLGELWRRNVEARPLPWHAEVKAREGAFATLLGLSIENEEWRAIALGDTCLFQVRSNSLLTCFPYTNAEQFAQRPTLPSSVQAADTRLVESIAEAQGTLVPADLLILATDGLAQWLFRRAEADLGAWDLFRSHDPTALAEIIDSERLAHRMRNDDVACAWLIA